MSLKSFMSNFFKGNNAQEKESANLVEEIIKAPISGKVLKLDQIKDPAFSSGMLGKGLAIDPIDGKVCSPVDGKISMLFDTFHAIGITSDKGVEILIHLGMDTVELKGKGFSSHIKNGDRIKAGQELIDIDIDLIKDAGYEVVTPVVITNLEDIKLIKETDNTEVNLGDEILSVEL
ncbi:PTS glucose transporter subunit IIA [uncultured Anaerococcus sp.]|uniref:PTS sugar transporter subunit IIA n=1 Tax=uncultured Anaerococcus sp. TaxID=293428 RepID=UPI00288B4EBF|nr:PTS glucose transporter subunit IIA [uncultured Anaerococcus sp.]